MSSADRTVVRAPGLGISVRLDRRVIPALLGLGAITLALAVLSVATGEYAIPLPDVARALLGLETGAGDGFVVRQLRLPRAVVAMAAGVGLGAAGGILQGLTRNPLAAPSIVGITQGAALAAVTVLVVFPDVGSVALPFVAFLGAGGAALLVYLLAWKEGLTPGRLILVGIGVAAIATALTTVILTFGNVYRAQAALVWMVGSVHGAGWRGVWTVAPWILLFLPAAFLGARSLNNLSLGDGVARGLGSRVELERGLLLLAAVALAGSAVSVAGAVAFVGLMAPHLARLLVGPAHEGLLPTAALMGGALVLAADLVGRSVPGGVEIPCGIVTGIVGAPFFGYLLYRGGRR